MYNLKDAKENNIDGLTFDSKAEARYYALLLQLQQEGAITSFIIQPRYVLQPAFKKNGKMVRKIEYVADFEVSYPDGELEVIDVKGFETKDFALKKKLFEFKYPHLQLKLMTFKYGRWMTIEEYKKEKKERAKK
ncbi:hypothetical protein TS65_09850 [Aneurinibacillus migulanus]|nr:hypothetical protein TS65_09850 [Aneurinibacillus migulanus]